MAAFASTPACSMASPAMVPTARGSISQHRSFTTTGVPVVCNRLKLVPKIRFSKMKLPTRSSCFKTTVSCSLADPETLKTVQNTIAKQLSIDLSSVAPETKFADLGADSLDTASLSHRRFLESLVEIMMALEEQFGFSVGEGGAENIATVQDAVDLIEKVKAAA
ncbi:Acyl carrier protein 1 [Hibiscus syriacus]|uniref:Acyl carrier protein 1 n=1 Tax=Hibiscus syriacus TaxID=106335 RepID=A0A6A3D3R0_HIBSY|nr:Acyl carrier protein 1 [Hibiscus syriacus]